MLICSGIKEDGGFQKWVPALFLQWWWGGLADNGDYGDVAATVIVCVWELIAVMQAAAWGHGWRIETPLHERNDTFPPNIP